MLPSRGLSRCLPVRRLPSKSIHGPPASRLFGTALRGDGRHLLARLPSQAAGTRIAGGVLATAGLFSQGRTAFQLRTQHPSQVRHASTTPSTTTNVGASSIDGAVASTSAPALGADPTSFSGGLDSLDGSVLLNLPEQIGYLKAMGIEFGWGPSSMVQWALEHLHVYTGLPWWASIVVFAIGFRMVLFPASVAASETAAKVNELKSNPKFKAAYENMLGLARSAGGDPTQRLAMMQARGQVNEMQKAAGIQMWRTFVPMLQLPFGIGFFRVLHAISGVPVPSFESGGILWFTNLTVPDPLFILPVVSSGVLYFAMNAAVKAATEPQQAAMMKMMQYIFVPVSCLVTLNLNAGTQVYIFATGLFQVLQTWVLGNPFFRRVLGLPVRPGRLPPGAMGNWQAPRATGTQQEAAASAAAAAGVDSANPVTNIKNAFSGTREKLSNFAANAQSKQSSRESKTNEQKRSMEQREQYYARRQDSVNKTQQRKSRGRDQ